MSDAVAGTKFSCEGCGRSYSWKPQLAGKRAKCKCGVTMTVPDAPPEAPEPEFDPDALYALADAESTAAANAPFQNRVVERPAPVQAKTQSSSSTSAVPRSHAALAVGYQRGPTQRDIERGNAIIDMTRDLYVPLGLFISGLVIYVAYYAMRYDLRGGAIGAVMFGLFVMTLFKAALLIGFALVVAGPLGVSFGGIYSAALKLAAIAVFSDGVTTWVDAGVEKFAGGGGAFAGMISFPILLAVVWILLIYLFSMDPGDSWMVVMVLAVFDFIVRWAILLILLKVVMSWGGVALPGAVVGGGGGGANSSMSNDPLAVEVQQLKEDKQLEEAAKYIEDGHQEILRPYVAEWYKVGCRNIWFTVGRGFDGKGVAGGVIVELPKDKASRAKCHEILKRYYDGAQIGYEPEDLEDDGMRYMSVQIRSAH